MERLFGEKVTDHTFTLSTEKQHLAERIARALIVQPILCSEQQALFHCDPHAGNLFKYERRTIRHSRLEPRGSSRGIRTRGLGAGHARGPQHAI